MYFIADLKRNSVIGMYRLKKNAYIALLNKLYKFFELPKDYITHIYVSAYKGSFFELFLENGEIIKSTCYGKRPAKYINECRTTNKKFFFYTIMSLFLEAKNNKQIDHFIVNEDEMRIFKSEIKDTIC